MNDPMKNLFAFKSVRQRMLVSFSLIILLVLFMGAYNILATNYNNKTAKEIANVELPLAIADKDLVENLANRIAMARGYLLFGGNFKNDFNIGTEQAIELRNLVRSIETTAEFEELDAKTIEWREYIVNEVFAIYDSGNQAAAMKNLEDITQSTRELMAGYEKLAENREASITDKENQVIKNGQLTLIISIVITLLVILISMLVALATSNIISKQIKTVMTRMKLIASGDLSREELQATSVDEIGQLVIATNDMNRSMRNVLNQINEVSDTVSSQSEELTQSANEVMLGTEQVAVTMSELATAAETQANSVNEVTFVSRDFSGKLQHAYSSGEQIQQVSNHILNMTKDGIQLMNASMKQMDIIDQIVHDAVQKVDGLDTYSQEISELVSVIKAIADQTNLLALNAAIEAARAGEHGNGFAVVANEVRKLAEESAVSVTTITEIVDRIQHESSAVSKSLQDGYADVEQGTKQIATTGETFQQISAEMDEMANNIDIVTDNLTELASASEQISSSIEDIAAITEESSAGIEQTSASTEQTSSAMEEVAASSKQLAQLAENLNKLVQQFKL